MQYISETFVRYSFTHLKAQELGISAAEYEQDRKMRLIFSNLYRLYKLFVRYRKKTFYNIPLGGLLKYVLSLI